MSWGEREAQAHDKSCLHTNQSICKGKGSADRTGNTDLQLAPGGLSQLISYSKENETKMPINVQDNQITLQIGYFESNLQAVQGSM